MIRVGVTGGIGSGKSTVCRLLAERDVPVYDSDSRARELMDGDGEIRRAIVSLLGSAAYRNDGSLDRCYVATKVFGDKMLLASLNAIVHPAVALDFEAWTLPFSSQPYVVLESAILLESGFNRFVDRVVTVAAPVEVRIERVVCRGVNREEVMRRMDNQLSDGERAGRAWRVIDNGGSMDYLARQVAEIHKLLLEQR
ncbi:MAG: dephospho-CoA kinase [Alistipes sp.]|jgi:dephospho-CoA kinase|nr:dephospho-CoA kinase [Alistipes sp.]